MAKVREASMGGVPPRGLPKISSLVGRIFHPNFRSLAAAVDGGEDRHTFLPQ
jgi:hypothetical protein